MTKQIKIWLVGNTGVRNPNRIHDGFKIFSTSSFVGNLRGKKQEVDFMDFLNKSNVINNKENKDVSASHARKWRLMFAKNGLIFPKVTGEGQQDELGPLDDITPFGKAFLKADSYPAVQEFFLRAMSVEQYESSQKEGFFSPLRWILALLLEIERRTGSAEISRIEFALWGQTTDPSDDVNEIVDRILKLRARRLASVSKRRFDRKEMENRGKAYDKQNKNFNDYADMNMRYLRITGILQKKGRGLSIVPSKHLLARQLAKSYLTFGTKLDQYKLLCNGASLPTDEIEVAKSVLNSQLEEARKRNIEFDISKYSLNTAFEVNTARKNLELLLTRMDEVLYANEQRNQWREISAYMDLLIQNNNQKKGNDKKKQKKVCDDEENGVFIPSDEMAAYLEWTLWRAALAIDHLSNKPHEIRGFNLDSSLLPVSTAGGGKGDLYLEFPDFMIVTEVTLTSSSRQEAMEGEPVRRHVADATSKYDKPVYGLFIANEIDTNTAETFRRGIWYTKDNAFQRLTIVPMTLELFKKFFVALFETKHANPYELRNLLLRCENKRDALDAPKWKEYINSTVLKRIEELSSELGT